MKMNKITQFLKKNVFYIAMGIVIVGALVAVLFLPKEGNVPPDANVQNKQASGKVTDEYEDKVVTVDDANKEDAVPSEVATNKDETLASEENTASDNVDASDEKALIDDNKVAENTQATTDNEKVETKTFEDTTVAKLDTPYFADGDTFALPVQGEVVVPYTDDTTKYWFSESLNQTMRTYGVCLKANEGEEVKAVAQGRVLDIISDSTTLEDADMPYVGSIMIVDLGNGYKVTYGFQNGTPNKDLKGQVVNTGDVLGTAGSPTGAFISKGDNIYLKLTHDDKIINPEGYLEVAQTE